MAARIWLRAARIFHIEARTDPQLEECLRGVIALQPQHEMANFLLEKILAEQGRFDEIIALQDKRIDGLTGDQPKIDLAKRIGNMWLLRWKDKDRAARFYGRALNFTYRGAVEAGKALPGHLAAFSLLRDTLAPKGEWAQLFNYADLGSFAPMNDEERGALMVQAAHAAWRDAGDPARAKPYFAEVQRVYPEHEELQAFVNEYGDPNAEAPAEAAAEPEAAVEAAAPVAEEPVAEAAPVEAEPVAAEPVAEVAAEAPAEAPAAEAASSSRSLKPLPSRSPKPPPKPKPLPKRPRSSRSPKPKLPPRRPRSKKPRPSPRWRPKESSPVSMGPPCGRWKPRRPSRAPASIRRSTPGARW